MAVENEIKEVDPDSASGDSAVHFVARAAPLHVVHALLSLEKNLVLIRNKFEETALTIALGDGNSELAHMLLSDFGAARSVFVSGYMPLSHYDL